METRNCQNCKNNFTIESDDFSFYEKIKVPPPTFCPECRLQRRMSYVNERNLYHSSCANCNKKIISMYSPQSNRVVWCTTCYFSDEKDSMIFGREYNFSINFFDQFKLLSQSVPFLHLAHKNNNSENCEYSNYAYRNRNAYLSFSVVRSEDIYYSKFVFPGNKLCVDSINIISNERCYELIASSGNYSSRFLFNSSACVECSYLFNCINCTNCFMSSGLRNKSYVFRGEQLSREEYLNHLKDENLDCYSSYGAHREEFVSLMNNSICRYANIKKSYDCTGDMIESSNNCKNCFGLLKVENSKYIYMGDNTTADCYDMFHTGRMQNCYEIAVAGSDCASDSFCVDVGTCIDSQYSISCNNCQSIFGCIGLQNKSYCILNKQYTKDEYIELVPKIIKSMNKAPFVDKAGRTYLYGEFFPSELSPFAYNESIVYENFPKSKQEVGLMGYAWLDSFKKENRGDMLIDDLPDRISDITEDILSKTIICPNSGQVETQCTSAYKIVPEELRFYRLMNIPIPRYCPNCRFHKRKDLVLPWKLWHRTCMCDKAGHLHEGKCEVQFETSYAPDRPEIVYCEKCYQQEVV